MSYPSSHHQFRHSDLQHLQNRVMVARLQELQKQQQHGHLGDAKSQSPLTTHLSWFGKQASGGLAVNSSDTFTANKMNWMHHNVSSPIQGFPSNSYLHDQGFMMNPCLQQPDVSLYGTPVASRRANIGHYSPLHGGVTLQNSPHADSLQKNISLLNYSGMHEQPSGTGFLHEKSKLPNYSGETAGLDPLEEKILFDTDNGWDSSLSKLAALDAEEYGNSSGVTEIMNPFSTVQSGSWSALMQSAVAEVSSSDTGVQEDLSGLSYQNMELSMDNQPSNLVTNMPHHFKCNDNKPESSSGKLKTPQSSCDSIMSSSLPNFQQTGLQSSFEQGLNKFSSDINIEQWSRLSQSLQSHQQSNQHIPSKHVRNDWQGDVLCGIGSSGGQHMSIAACTLNQKENENKSPRYNDGPLKNGPMGVEAANKNAAHTYASQNYQGENSSDSYNSKISHAYTAQPNHACLNAADSESSARSSQKSPNQGKHNQSEDALSKCSPASNICVSMDSKNTPEHHKGSLVSDHGGTTKFGSAVSQTDRGPTQDIFSFQSSVFGDSVTTNLGNEQKGETWWMPSSFGQSVPALQGASTQKWSARSRNLGNSGSTNQVEGKSIPDMSVPSESMSKKAEMGQVSLSGSSQGSCLLENASITGFQNYASAPLQDTLPCISHLNQHSVKTRSVQMSMSSQGDVLVDPFKVSYNLNNFSTPYFNGKDQSSLVDPSARNSEITISGDFNSHIHASVLNSDINWQQRVHQAHLLASNHHNQSTGNNNGYDMIGNLSSGAQIASNLCNQYQGTNNALILSPFDASKISSTEQAETFQLSGRHTDAVDGGMSPANQMVANQQGLASSILPANADNMNLILSMSRKRKFSTYEGLPWQVEVMQNSWKLPDISIAEQDWAKATNRLVEERVNENDTLEEMYPVARGKKRLILTSQLMQQVFRPPPPGILRIDATSDYELVAYFVAKVALADSCKLISKPRIHIPRAHGDMIINASSNGHDSLVKDAEVLVERAMKLESQIEGLDGSLSTVDIRRECQELEKFSLINHFAKYHGQLAQSNATNTQSPFLQRYINPTVLPQKFPEGTKCLSL